MIIIHTHMHTQSTHLLVYLRNVRVLECGLEHEVELRAEHVLEDAHIHHREHSREVIQYLFFLLYRCISPKPEAKKATTRTTKSKNIMFEACMTTHKLTHTTINKCMRKKNKGKKCRFAKTKKCSICDKGKGEAKLLPRRGICMRVCI